MSSHDIHQSVVYHGSLNHIRTPRNSARPLPWMQHGLFLKGVNLRNGLTAKAGTPNRSASSQGVQALACPESLERFTGIVGTRCLGLLT